MMRTASPAPGTRTHQCHDCLAWVADLPMAGSAAPPAHRCCWRSPPGVAFAAAQEQPPSSARGGMDGCWAEYLPSHPAPPPGAAPCEEVGREARSRAPDAG